MKNRRSIRENHAVAGVIEALLMVALVAIVLSIIQLEYVPRMVTEKEAAHMDEVSNQFSTLKSMIEMQAVTNSSAPISTILTLGSRELPYFISGRALGEVRVQDTDDWNINVDFGAFVYELNSIIYEAYNTRFVDQTYILEGGGIIRKQSDSVSVMLVDPSIRIENKSNIDIYFDLPIIIGIHGKDRSPQSYKKIVIRTNWSEGATDSIPNVNSIKITTQYPNAWNESIYQMIEENVDYDLGESYIEISKKADGKNINLIITYYYIYTQIGYGWIK